MKLHTKNIFSVDVIIRRKWMTEYLIQTSKQTKAKAVILLSDWTVKPKLTNFPINFPLFRKFPCNLVCFSSPRKLKWKCENNGFEISSFFENSSDSNRNNFKKQWPAMDKKLSFVCYLLVFFDFRWKISLNTEGREILPLQ